MRATSKKSNQEGLLSRPIRAELATAFHDRLEGFESSDELRLTGDHQPDYSKVLLASAVSCGASDIHFESFSDGARLRFRIDGIVWDVAQLTIPQAKVILNQLKAVADLDPVVRFTPKDARAVFQSADGHIDLRVAIAPGPVGETMSIRLLDPRRLERSILELGLSEDNLDLTALRNWGLPDHEIAESLSVVVAQRLVRKLCSSCRRKRKPGENEKRWMKSLHLKPPTWIWQAEGCSKCRGLGYEGRSGVFELWRLNAADYRAILNHDDEISIREIRLACGHRTILEDALDKVAKGVTSLEEVRRIAVGVFPSYKTKSPAKRK